MTEYRGTSGDIRGRTMFECVDQDQESLPDSEGNTEGPVFYFTTLKQLVTMVIFPAHLMTRTKNSTV